MNRQMRRRELLKLSAATGGALFLSACMAPEGARPSPSASAAETPGTAGKYPLGKLEGAEVILDASKFPKTFKEAPELATLVQQGKLPKVADRIGQDPLVIKPVQSVGKYGGTLRKAFIGAGDGTAFRFACGPDSLLYWDWQWKKVIPNLARDFEQSADGKTLTVRLRRGMKWSDGQPFTAADIMFWYEDIYKNKDVVAAPNNDLLINGKEVKIEQVDEFTIRFVSPDPNYLLASRIASGSLAGQSAGGDRGLGLMAPKHYLSKLHTKYGVKADIDKAMADGKFTGWGVFFKAKMDWLNNVDLPVLAPWKTTRAMSDPQLFAMERNPYSVWVDTDGNQLPYIGKIEHNFASDTQVIALRATNGEYDFQDRLFDASQLPVLIDSQQRGNYKIYLDPSQDGIGLNLNLAYQADPEIGDLLRNADFRRALSMGLDRAAINETFFLGTGTPSASLPADDNKYFPGKEYRTKWATLDVAQANSLLDKIGLTKGADGFRQRKDGKGRVQLEFLAVNRLTDFPQMAEVIKRQWNAIGIDLIIQTANATLALERIAANAAQMTGNQVASEDLFLSANPILPGGQGFSQIIGLPYGQWMSSGGRTGKEPYPELKQYMELWAKGYGSPDAERIEIGKEIFRQHVDNVYTIGIIGQGLLTYSIRYAKNTLGNVPGRIVNASIIRTSVNTHPMTFFFK